MDFGCGTGLLTEELGPIVKSVLAIDAMPAMVAEFKRKLMYNHVRHGFLD